MTKQQRRSRCLVPCADAGQPRREEMKNIVKRAGAILVGGSTLLRYMLSEFLVDPHTIRNTGERHLRWISRLWAEYSAEKLRRQQHKLADDVIDQWEVREEQHLGLPNEIWAQIFCYAGGRDPYTREWSPAMNETHHETLINISCTSKTFCNIIRAHVRPTLHCSSLAQRLLDRHIAMNTKWDDYNMACPDLKELSRWTGCYIPRMMTNRSYTLMYTSKNPDRVVNRTSVNDLPSQKVMCLSMDEAEAAEYLSYLNVTPKVGNYVQNGPKGCKSADPLRMDCNDVLQLRINLVEWHTLPENDDAKVVHFRRMWRPFPAVAWVFYPPKNDPRVKQWINEEILKPWTQFGASKTEMHSDEHVAVYDLFSQFNTLFNQEQSRVMLEKYGF